MKQKMMIAGLVVTVGMSGAASFAEPQDAVQDQPLKIMENPIERPMKAEPQVTDKTDKTKAGKEKARDAAEVMTEHEKERMELRQTKVQPEARKKIEPQNQQ